MKQLLKWGIVGLMVIALAGCIDLTQEQYKYPAFAAAATSSLLGANEVHWAHVRQLDEDQYGRCLFMFVSDEHVGDVLAVLVVQKITINYVDYYDGVNFLLAQETYLEYPEQATANTVRLYFSDAEIEQLKSTNDWGLPLQPDKFFTVPVYAYKDDPVNHDTQEATFNQVSNKFHPGSSIFLASDHEGKMIYFMQEFEFGLDGNPNIYGKAYLVMFDKQGKLTGSQPMQEIVDLWHYEKQLMDFKTLNGWEFTK